MWGLKDWSEFGEVIAGLGAFAAALLSFQAAQSSEKLARQGVVSQALKQYLSSYMNLIALPDGAKVLADAQAFGAAADRPALQQRAAVTAGLLVGVIESMAAAEDQRLHAWARYLRGVKGPLLGYPEIGAYCATQRGREFVAATEVALRKGEQPPEWS